MAARPRRRRRAAPRRRARSWLRRQDLFTRGLLAAVAALSALVFLLIVSRLNDERGGHRQARVAPPARSAAVPARRATLPRPAATGTRQRPVATAPSTPPLATAAHAPQHPAPRIAAAGAVPAVAPRAAILIDDLGQSLSHLQQLAALELPLSIAVIPGLPASVRTVGEATRLGIEMLLHQPMEPHEEGGKNPGEGVLLTSMNAADLRARVSANLAAVPGAVGVNNHMGSRFTEDAAGLDALMAEIGEHGLFWLDSRTTPATRGVAAAGARGVPSIERDVFIDAERDADAIRSQLRKLIACARSRGDAVGIGHPYPETIAALREMRGELLASGVALVRVSALVRRAPAAAPGAALASVTSRTGPGAGPGPGRETATP